MELTSLQKAYFTIRKQENLIARLQQKLDTPPVAIVGLGCRFPGKANNEHEFWKLLEGGHNAIREVPSDRWSTQKYYHENPLEPGKTNSKWGGFVEDFAHFDPDFFNISGTELLEMDPQQRLLLLTTYEALENAGYWGSPSASATGGVFVGIGGMDHGLYLGDFTNPHDIGAYMGSGNAYSVASGRLSNYLGWNGPSVSYDTACSSSLIAVHYACMHLATMDCDVAVAGGVNVLMSERVQISLSKAGMLASDGQCKTFDKKADGYVRSEGCGMLVLKRLEDAIRDNDPVRAVIAGSAIAHDGNSGGLTVPNPVAQENVIRKAILKAGLNPSDIQYVEAHGTGTLLGDPIEIEALDQVFGKDQPSQKKVPVGSVKTNVGHLEAGAGVAGIIKVILALENKVIPKHLNCDEPNDLIDWENMALEVCREQRHWNFDQTRYAGISSFGFAGTIGHMILKEAPEVVPVIHEKRAYDLVISARTAQALEDFIQAYAAYLQTTGDSWGDICYTAGKFRPRYDHHFVVRASTKEEAVSKLSKTGHHENGLHHEDLLLPAEGLKVVLPNYPFQTSFYLAHRREQPLPSMYRPVWVPMPVRPSEIKGGNYVLVSPGQNGVNTGISKHIKLQYPGTIIWSGDDWHQQIPHKQWFDGEPYTMVYITPQAEETDFNQLVWQMIAGLSSVLESPNPPECIFLLGEEGPFLQGLSGALKTIALEHPTFEYKQLTLEQDRWDGPEVISYLNRDYPHRQVQIGEATRFLQLTPMAVDHPGETLQFDTDKVYIISGGLGSLGRQLAAFLIEKGAEQVWLLSRKGVEHEQNEERLAWLKKWQEEHPQLEVISCDCRLESDMQRLHASVTSRQAQIGGVFHVAGVNKQQVLADITEQDCAHVLDAKVKGAILLDHYSRLWEPEYFVLYSSIASVWGSGELTHYAAANAFLDGLVSKRRAAGLPGLSINWSAWEGSHMVTADPRGMELLKESGLELLSPAQALKGLEYLLPTNYEQVIVCENDWSKFIPLMEMNGPNPFWDQLRVTAPKLQADPTEIFIPQGETRKEKYKSLLHRLMTELLELLKFPKEKIIDEEKPFNELGVDSIMAVQFIRRINSLMQLEISTNAMFNYPNLALLTDFVLEKHTSTADSEDMPVEEAEVHTEAANEDWLDKIERQLQKYEEP